MKPKTRNQTFIEICATIAQNFPQDAEFKYSFSGKCKHCGREFLPTDEITITTSYWGGFTFSIHKGCKTEYEASEKFECQKIDADCNDCKSFAREKGMDGICNKTGEVIKATPNFCSSKECFEHRKAVQDDIK